MEPSDEPTLLEQARPAERAEDALLLDRVRAQLFQRAAPATVGRYRLAERLGAGGMGVVYAAHDPKLSRQVAIKLLNNERAGEDTTRARARMLREAKAMAALSHPNVLPIFDVGEDRCGVFLAMELVEGVSLDEWLGAERRSIREVLEVFTAAADGLGAAHRAGLVHRDFKPANVMIDHRAHVYVMDFGLARTASASTLETPEGRTGHDNVAITQTGVANGSPAYMSPQQHDGERPDPASDQWSFGVSLYEALYGRMPFLGRTMAELRVSVFRGIEHLPRRAPPVPTHIEAVILRALRQNPADRFPSMAALVAALNPRPRARAAAWLSGLGVLGAVGWASSSVLSATPTDCGPDRSSEVWNHARRQGLASGFQQSNRSFVTNAWPRIEGQLDAYFNAWVDAFSQSCKLPDEARARVHACLDLRLQSLDDTLTVLEQSEPAVVAKVNVVGNLPAIAECERVILGRGHDDSLNAPEAAPIVARLNKGLSLTTATKYDDALSLLREALPLAQELTGRTLEVRVLVAIGQAQALDDDAEASLETLEQAVLVANGASLDAEAIDAATEAGRIAVQDGRLEEADRWIALAHARLEATGERGVRSGRLALVETDVAEAKGLFERSEALANRAVEELDDAEPGDLGIAWVVVGRAHYRAARWRQAEEAYKRAIDLLLPQTGEQHPTVLTLRINIALAAVGAEDFARARDLIAPTIPALEDVLGPSSEAVAMAYGNLALAYDGLGDDDRSLELQRKALEIRREVLGEHPHVAMNTYNVAVQLTDRGEAVEATALFRESIRILSATVGPDNHLLRGPHLRAAQANLDLGRLDDAERHLERARELQVLHGASENTKVRASFYGARLAGARGNADEARRLVAEARATLGESGDPGRAFATEIRAQIEAWEQAQ